MTSLRDFQAEIQQTHSRSLAKQRAHRVAGEATTEHRHDQQSTHSAEHFEDDDILVCLPYLLSTENLDTIGGTKDLAA